jgi:hypothetical protein
MSRIRFLGAILTVGVLLGTTGATAARPSPISATVGGTRIPLSRVGSLHCHDLESPVIRCFRTGRQLERAMARSLARTPWRVGGTTIQATAYVRVYEHNDLDGASMVLSSSYSNLGTIGWNDRISSYRVLNGGSGVFFPHAGHGGTGTSFCCDIEVYDLGAKNDTFSSVTGSA